MIKDLPELLERKQVCELLHITGNTFIAQCQRGELPAVKIGRRWYVRKNDLLKMLGVEQ